MVQCSKNAIDSLKQTGRDNKNAIIQSYICFSYRIIMALSCTQLCLQCRSLLLSRMVACSRRFSPPLGYSTTFKSFHSKVLNGSSVHWWAHTTTWARQRWIQRMFVYNDFAVKHLSTETKGGKDIEGLSRDDVVSYKSPLLPVSDTVPLPKVQMPLGTYWV